MTAAESRFYHHEKSNTRRINLLPVAAPHPTGPQRGGQQGGRKQGVRKKDGKEEVRPSQRCKRWKQQEEKVKACYCGTDMARCKEERNLCPV